MRTSNPSARALTDQMEDDDVVRWAHTLPRARLVFENFFILLFQG